MRKVAIISILAIGALAVLGQSPPAMNVRWNITTRTLTVSSVGLKPARPLRTTSAAH